VQLVLKQSNFLIHTKEDNMSDLYKLLNKLSAIDNGTTQVAESVELSECGDMPQPGHEGNVQMNITMNGTGEDGIRDLMNILRTIEQPAHGGGDAADQLFGDDGEVEIEVGEEYGNSAPDSTGQFTADVGAVTPTGNDMASKGIERPKVNGGGNPMQEALLQDLHALYARIKESK
jgi:hypothetical protein